MGTPVRELQTNVHVTETVTDDKTGAVSVVDHGMWGPNYPRSETSLPITLADDHPARVRQRLTQEDIETLAAENDARYSLLRSGMAPGFDLRAYASDFRAKEGDQPNLPELEVYRRAEAGMTEVVAGSGAGGSPALPPLPEGWEKENLDTRKAYAVARGVTIAPNDKSDDVNDKLRASGA